MHNISLTSLTLLSFFSMSPLYTINRKNFKSFSLISKSHFSHSYSHIIYSGTNFFSAEINNNAFTLTLSTPLVFIDSVEYYDGVCRNDQKCCVSKNYDFKPGQTIENLNLTPNDFPDWNHKRPHFERKQCGDLKITKCNFQGCFTETNEGGGIIVSAYLALILHHCTFDDCRSNLHGAGGAIGTTFGFVDENPDFGNTKKLDIQYTCFSNCYQLTDQKGFGTALIMAAEDVIFYYASTVNCPCNGKTAYGAQFDIKASKSITSQFVNATGGKSLYCGAMEYRKATSGFFQYQTLTQMKCKYVSAFTSVEINDINIRLCNVNDNEISGDTSKDNNMPALVFTREKNLIVSNFFFFNNNFGSIGLIAERDSTKVTEGVTCNIKLIDCYADFNDETKWKKDYVHTEGCKFSNPIEKTLGLRQLQLGHCQGEIPPGPMIISQTFTPSGSFSNSDVFTKTNGFTETADFTVSDHFTNSKKFSLSGTFTDSDHWDRTHSFTSSRKFSPSKKFSASSNFTGSDDFTKSGQFTTSKIFSSSNDFTFSKGFSQTKDFTKSYDFTSSRPFTHSNHFSNSIQFSKSDAFFSDKGVNIDSSNKTSTGTIIGAVIGSVAGAAVIAALAAFFIIRKKKLSMINDSANVMKETDSSVTVDNNLNSIMDKDDPFAHDFANELNDLN